MSNFLEKRFLICIYILIFSFLIPISLFSQELPDGFMDMKLGLTIEDTKQALKENTFFDYRGDPDVSMLMTEGENLIETRGFSYIDKGYFHFYEDRLFIITIVLDREKMDFYTMHMNLEKKYGKADRLSPEGVYWENESVSLALEKPLVVKYTDLQAREIFFSRTREAETSGAILKAEFLDIF